MNRSTRLLLAASCSLAALIACSGSHGGDGAPSALDPGTSTAAVTYFRDVKPIVDAKCTQCHQAGGIAPFTLTSADDVVAHKDAIVAATQSRTMPPWPPSDACAQYVADRSLDDAQIATLAAWTQQGAALGDPADFHAAAATPPTMSRVDRKLSLPQPFTPTQAPDDYRCFILDWPETATQFVTGFGGAPDHASIVHHMLAFVADPSEVATYQQLDDADPGPGYTCFGGPGGAPGAARMLGGWAPGALGQDFAPGTGIRVDPGSKVIVQIHYNTLNAPATADQSSVLFEIEGSVQKEAFMLPWTNPAWIKQKTMSIAAGNPDVAYSFGYDALTGFSFATKGKISASAPVTAYSAALHMHQLGKRATLSIDHAAGGSECMLDIERWDFHWQGSYGFTAPKTIAPGDALKIECHWDNSASNQPIVGGQQATPRDVNWGEGTTDEMCLGYVYVTQ